jgi:microcompartment protein CcmK/EutM
MILARVKGTVVATHHDPGFHGLALKIVEKVESLEETAYKISSSRDLIAIDRVGANEGEFVLLETSMESCLGMDRLCAADAAIVAIVDTLTG